LYRLLEFGNVIFCASSVHPRTYKDLQIGKTSIGVLSRPVVFNKGRFMKNSSTTEKVQGEGDVAADRRYRDATEKFVKSGKIGDAVKKAKPQTLKEEKELDDAERVGLSKSKGEDPSLPQSPKRKT
jgi:hypothetical protein